MHTAENFIAMVCIKISTFELFCFSYENSKCFDVHFYCVQWQLLHNDVVVSGRYASEMHFLISSSNNECVADIHFMAVSNFISKI